MIEKLEQMLFDQNWGRYSFDIQQATNQGLLNAGIDTKDNWKIHIFVDERLKELDKILSKFSLNGRLLSRFKSSENYFAGKDNLYSILYSIVAHEVGHWKYCPFDEEYVEEITSGVSEGLEEIGFTKQEIQQYTPHIQNMFADIIDDIMNMYRDKKKQAYQDGFLAYYAKEGVLNGMSDAFCLFTDTITKLGIDDKEMKGFSKAFNKHYNKLQPEVRKIIHLLTGSENSLTKKIMAHKELTLDEKVKIYHRLDDKDSWHRKAMEFAKIVGPYMQKEKQQNKSMSQDTQNQSGMPQPGQGQPQPQQGQMDEKKIRAMVKKSLEKGHSVSYAPDHIALDELYKQRAEKIVMKIREEQGEDYQLPVGYLNKKELDEANFDINKVDWQNPEVGVDEEGNDELQFFEKQAPFFSDNKGAEKGGRVPDILFIIDKSGSMTGDYDPKAGTGDYDMLLRSVYSVFKNLEDNDLIQNMRFGTILFEAIPNYFSGWHTYYDMDDTKKPLLDPNNIKYHKRPISHKEFARNQGGTNLDAEVVKQAAEEAPGKFWAIIVSDGDIHNYSEATQAVSYLAEQGHHISFIETGSPFESLHAAFGLSSFGRRNYNSFADHVKSVGGDVHQVRNPEELPKVILGKADEIYETACTK